MSHFFTAMARALFVSDRIRITDADRRFVNERDADKPCGLCDQPIGPDEDADLHHKAYAEGGHPSTPDNLVRAHRVCNEHVGTRDMGLATALARAMSSTWREARKREAAADADLPEIYMGRRLR